MGKEFSLPAGEAEEVSAEDSKENLAQESCEIHQLVEALNNSLSHDEVSTGSLSGMSNIEQTRDVNEEEKPGLGGAQKAGAGKVSSSGAVEVDARHVQEPIICTNVAVETTGQTANKWNQSPANGVDDADDQSLNESNLGGDKLESSGLVHSFSPYPGQLDAEGTYVWYACYASNMLMARFMCYIKGGQVEGMGKVCLGSRNQTPPVASRWVMLPYNLFFGHTWTSTWGSGGVAFLDPVSRGGAPTTHIRLYKITLQQFRDLLVQENQGDPNKSQLVLEWGEITKLREDQSASSHATLDILKESWYGTIKCLGDEDGLPILTVTCSVENMERFRKGQLEVCQPSESYVTVILKGLLEHETLSKDESRAYISSRSKGVN